MEAQNTSIYFIHFFLKVFLFEHQQRQEKKILAPVKFKTWVQQTFILAHVPYYDNIHSIIVSQLNANVLLTQLLT
jgi:hypothetical protein